MGSGDFERAWQITDALESSRRAGVCQPGPHHLLWDGTPIEGRRVLVRCRHGLGDTIQFLRYVPALLRVAGDVYVDVQPALRALVNGMQGFRPFGAELPEVEIESMELPYYFRTVAETIPGAVPYLPALEISSAYPPFTRADGHYKVGLIWSSGGWDCSRSIPPDCLAPLQAAEGVQFYSLQQGAASRDPIPLSVVALSPRTEEVRAAAAAMLEMDLVITVDTMTAHLAGALGRPVWTLLPYRADWRWMRGRDDSPWYPTMRLFRQRSPGNWHEAIASVVSALGSSR